MPKRMTERYDVEKMRVMRGELPDWPNTGKTPLSDFVDAIAPGGTVFHILTDIPDDSGLDLTILVDGETVVRFELPYLPQRSFLGQRKVTYLVGGPPCDIKVWPLRDFRHEIGQGRYRMLLDHAVADARRLLNQKVA